MALILHIDTATAIGSVSLSENGVALETMENIEQRDHAATVGIFVKTLLERHHRSAEELDAIAVSAGPGSYTGLRVGAATAKGLCYTWNKPLIAVSTLQMMANGMKAAYEGADVFLVPMIDARRMEVFTAVYNKDLEPVLEPQAMILETQSFDPYMIAKNTIFFGDGAPKWQVLLGVRPNASFPAYHISAAHMVPLAEKSFASKHFEDVAYFTPNYLKAFYHPGKK
ncbi:tRNA (adenosine(37)-N6)-threonylcarbamoyltransferase complex dimerization subunit type 1 TsaB [Chitinophaga niabensis]|uniref:tRNA (adenosine(37)-N6)-threonylcarbamoyltransferase complex dimerization subunit type 1 TsaB n=1 Tax=Chitinophaga niabensis TaxID=536979 RepID=UPI0009413A58|nr:tRNA (adenosine(37)-N6)-threonylcarbamoyltransferase complex dimerization subunit type 1 TsaB [Chitinophaga niabensis]